MIYYVDSNNSKITAILGRVITSPFWQLSPMQIQKKVLVDSLFGDFDYSGCNEIILPLYQELTFFMYVYI